MLQENNIQFIKDHAEKYLKDFTQQVRYNKDEQWRCLYAAIDPDVTKKLHGKNIAATFLKTSFDKADDVKAFWLDSGHLFIFFQGPVRAVIKDYERLLESFSTGEARAEYHFFWEVNEFWGYFDQVLASVIEKKPTKQNTPNKEQDKFAISEDLCRQRQSRYKPLLLIVEDDRVTRHMLQAIMEKYCDIAVAWDAEQARQLYQSMSPNITFLDIELPDGDGLELAELFCKNDDDSFIVMVSGCSTTEAKSRSIKAGTKGFVTKPATEARLLKFIDQYNSTKQDRCALR